MQPQLRDQGCDNALLDQSSVDSDILVWNNGAIMISMEENIKKVKENLAPVQLCPP
jgi:hypothetical protein